MSEGPSGQAAESLRVVPEWSLSYSVFGGVVNPFEVS